MSEDKHNICTHQAADGPVDTADIVAALTLALDCKPSEVVAKVRVLVHPVTSGSGGRL